MLDPHGALIYTMVIVTGAESKLPPDEVQMALDQAKALETGFLSVFKPAWWRLRNVLRAGWFQRAIGFLAAEFLRLVWLTNRFSFDPPDVYAIVEPQMPVILAFDPRTLAMSRFRIANAWRRFWAVHSPS